MGIVSDLREVIQDLVAPEMQEIKVRLQVVEEQMKDLRTDMKDFRGEMKDRFSEINNRLSEAERNAQKRHEEMLDQVRVTVDYANVLVRLNRVEEEQKRLKQ